MVSFISNLLELKKIEDLTHLGYKKPTNFIRKNFPQSPGFALGPETGNFRNHPKRVPRSPWMKSCLFSIFNEKFHKVWQRTLKGFRWFLSCQTHVWQKSKPLCSCPLNVDFFQHVSIPHSNHFHAVSSISLARYQQHPTSMSDMSLKFTQPVKDSCTTRRCSSAARAA